MQRPSYKTKQPTQNKRDQAHPSHSSTQPVGQPNPSVSQRSIIGRQVGRGRHEASCCCCPSSSSCPRSPHANFNPQPLNKIRTNGDHNRRHKQLNQAHKSTHAKNTPKQPTQAPEKKPSQPKTQVKSHPRPQPPTPPWQQPPSPSPQRQS